MDTVDDPNRLPRPELMSDTMVDRGLEGVVDEAVGDDAVLNAD